MAKFLALIWGDEATWLAATPEWQQANGEGHRAFNQAAGSAVLGGHELEPTARSVSLRGRAGGRTITTDGPFLESKEVIGGFYLLEAPDLAEATRLAGLLPEASAPTSGVEVRPIRGR